MSHCALFDLGVHYLLSSVYPILRELSTILAQLNYADPGIAQGLTLILANLLNAG